MSHETPLIGTTLDEKYSILKQLGEGGMGSVYLARHLGTKRLVALKVIVQRMTNSAEFLERFRREAEAAGSLRHPNVVDVTDFGFARVGSSDIAYLVMEYLDGCTLAEVLYEEKRLPLKWVVDIVDQVCSAVDEAHKRGIVHRDLKPQNIWLEPDRRGGFSVKVLDFGLAKIHDAKWQETTGGPVEARPSITKPLQLPETLRQAFEAPTGTVAWGSKPAAEEVAFGSDTDSGASGKRSLSGPRVHDSLTQVGTILGTPYYMSPEQCRGMSLDGRSDIYSIGVMAYEMLAGERPFTGDPVDVMAKHVLDPAKPLSEVAPDVPKNVSDIVMSALEKGRDDRPQRATLLSSALRANAEGVMVVLRRAVGICSDNFDTFLRLFAIAFVPVIGLRLLRSASHFFEASAPQWFTVTWNVVFGVIALGIATFLAAAISRGVSAMLLAQLAVAPLRKVRIHLALSALRKRIGPLLLGSVVYLGIVAVPLAIFITTLRWGLAGAPHMFEGPGRTMRMVRVGGEFLLAAASGYVAFRNFITYALFPVVLLLEGLGVRAALERSRALVSRGRRFILPIAFIEFGEYVLEVVLGLFFMSLSLNWTLDKVLNIASDAGLELLVVPIEAVAYAMIYLKLRQAGGESLDEMLDEQFVEQEIPKTKWMQRMQKRAASGVSGV